MKKITLFPVAMLGLLTACQTGQDKSTFSLSKGGLIHSAGPWLDTEGKKIEAHGFQVFYNEQNSTYYWYGENKEHTHKGSNVWTWGIRAYSSRDFVHYWLLSQREPGGTAR